MIDKVKLKIILLKKGKSMRGLANYLGISTPTLYRKLNGKSDFFREEMLKTKEYCEEDNMDEVFFADEVA